MPEGLVTASGKKLGAQPAGTPDTSAFDAVVAGAKTAETDELAPPKREKPVPDEDEAKEIRRTARKTPAKPRATSAPPKAPQPAKDYTADLNGLGEALWVGLSSLPMTAGYAPLVNEANRLPMVNAWNQAAQQSPVVRGYIEQLTSGGGNTWILGVAIATVPVAITAYQLATNPQLRAQAAEANKAELTHWALSKGLLQAPAEAEDVPQAA